jgi:hypothetical protein
VGSPFCNKAATGRAEQRGVRAALRSVNIHRSSADIPAIIEGGARRTPWAPFFNREVSMSAQSPKPEASRVIVVDFDMSFLHMVGFFVKAVFAAIPAAIIVAIICTILALAFGAMFGGLGHWMR